MIKHIIHVGCCRRDICKITMFVYFTVCSTIVIVLTL